MDLFDKKVKAEFATGANIKVNALFTFIKGKCFLLKGGVETLVNIGAKALVELGMVLPATVQLKFDRLSEEKIISLGSLYCRKRKIEIDVEAIKASMDEAQATLGDKLEVTHNQVVAKQSELSAIQASVSVNNTPVERSGTTIASTGTELTQVETIVAKCGAQVMTVDSQLERSQTAVSQRGGEVKQCGSSLSKQRTVIQSNNLLMLG
ncbi:hypothetical protein [unidentified bacterial endosymbiont]|uniref:hypothetical protein n=1 Tax=unidentified bacterial endosymbiont TaxID=2355 RepID=UPI0020A1D304|nr:hypothetical protein [unidentified bacterial endosymbiont]